MGLREVLGMTESKRIRYGIVGLGSISQEAMMPGVEHTGNSKITALVTSDTEKARALAEKYDVETTCGYEHFDELLRSGRIDAVYIGTPNWRHAEFAIPALRAGIHVLLEKPMEISSQQCEAILEARSMAPEGTKLMVAYRLHFEPATIAAIEKVRSGDLGRVHLFSSTFAQMVDSENHRAQNGLVAGPIFDMGPYPVNAVRNLFESEPIEAFATGVRHPESGFGDFDDTVCVTLRFPGERLANFTVSYFGNTLDTYTVLGTKGLLEVNPGYMYGKPLEHFAQYGESDNHESFKNTDHFGGEMKYFSDCILDNTEPEPNGAEGLADVRVLEAIAKSLRTGKFEKVVQPQTAGRVEAVSVTRPISPEQEQTLAAVSTPEMVHASSPARGQEKNPRN
jgi:predicted dehydrogenase